MVYLCLCLSHVNESRLCKERYFNVRAPLALERSVHALGLRSVKFTTLHTIDPMHDIHILATKDDPEHLTSIGRLADADRFRLRPEKNLGSALPGELEADATACSALLAVS